MNDVSPRGSSNMPTTLNLNPGLPRRARYKRSQTRAGATGLVGGAEALKVAFFLFLDSFLLDQVMLQATSFGMENQIASFFARDSERKEPKNQAKALTA